MKLRLRHVCFALLTFCVLAAGWYVTSVSAEQTVVCDAGALFCFQPLADQPLEIIRTIEVPNVAVPYWLGGN